MVFPPGTKESSFDFEAGLVEHVRDNVRVSAGLVLIPLPSALWQPI